AQAELATRTLLVVVSDHGERSRAAVPDNYRVPLLVVGEDVASGEDDSFRSHLDLQAIVAHFLLGAKLPAPRQEIFVVGSTERWVYGEIRALGEHVLVDDNAGRVLAGSLGAAAVHDTFQAYVASFSAAFGPK
ncbi:MAG: sulfatase, partial [Planctomycetes bacterium]|nr:sulfatase [Planctomycetota bacterium]